MHPDRGNHRRLYYNSFVDRLFCVGEVFALLLIVFKGHDLFSVRPPRPPVSSSVAQTLRLLATYYMYADTI